MRKKQNAKFKNVVKNRKLPILTLDARWHELFPEDKKTSEIKELEQKVNNLLKRQGKLINDVKDMKKLKSNLLKDIVVNMDISTDIIGKAKEKKLNLNKRYIQELNVKIDQAMDELGEIPYQIREANEELVLASIDIFYNRLLSNRDEIKEISDWITDVREELKNKILLKQDMEAKNDLIYTYMHDLLGAELMEQFDSVQLNSKKF